MKVSVFSEPHARIYPGWHAAHAFALLVYLRGRFTEQCRSGGAFKITPKVCARTRVPLLWTRERYEVARNQLLRIGYLRLLMPFRMTADGPRPAQYTLTPKGIKPPDVAVARALYEHRAARIARGEPVPLPN
jgi:hypothetical protein